MKDADGSLNKAEETPSADNPVTKVKKPVKKAARNRKSKLEVVVPVDQPADRKKAAVKKPVRKAAKKAASKPDAKTRAKTNNASSPAVSKTKHQEVQLAQLRRMWLKLIVVGPNLRGVDGGHAVSYAFWNGQTS